MGCALAIFLVSVLLSSVTDNTEILSSVRFLLKAPKMSLLSASKDLMLLHRSFHIKPCKVCGFSLLLQVKKTGLRGIKRGEGLKSGLSNNQS